MNKPIQLLLVLLCIALLFLSPNFRVSADESPRAAVELAEQVETEDSALEAAWLTARN